MSCIPNQKSNYRNKMGSLSINGKTYVLYEGINTIGRCITATVPLKHLDISKQHAIVTIIDENQHYVSDFQSFNGTSLNHSKLQPLKLYKLSDGNMIEFANITATYSTVLLDAHNQTNFHDNTDQNIENTQIATQSFYNATTQAFVKETTSTLMPEIQKPQNYFDDDYNFEDVSTQVVPSNVTNVQFKVPLSIHEMPTQAFCDDVQLSVCVVSENAGLVENTKAQDKISYGSGDNNAIEDIHEMETQKIDNFVHDIPTQLANETLNNTAIIDDTVMDESGIEQDNMSQNSDSQLHVSQLHRRSIKPIADDSEPSEKESESEGFQFRAKKTNVIASDSETDAEEDVCNNKTEDGNTIAEPLSVTNNEVTQPVADKENSETFKFKAKKIKVIESDSETDAEEDRDENQKGDTSLIVNELLATNVNNKTKPFETTLTSIDTDSDIDDFEFNTQANSSIINDEDDDFIIPSTQLSDDENPKLDNILNFGGKTVGNNSVENLANSVEMESLYLEPTQPLIEEVVGVQPIETEAEVDSSTKDVFKEPIQPGMNQELSEQIFLEPTQMIETPNHGDDEIFLQPTQAVSTVPNVKPIQTNDDSIFEEPTQAIINTNSSEVFLQPTQPIETVKDDDVFLKPLPPVKSLPNDDDIFDQPTQAISSVNSETETVFLQPTQRYESFTQNLENQLKEIFASQKPVVQAPEIESQLEVNFDSQNVTVGDDSSRPSNPILCTLEDDNSERFESKSTEDHKSDEDSDVETNKEYHSRPTLLLDEIVEKDSNTAKPTLKRPTRGRKRENTVPDSNEKVTEELIVIKTSLDSGGEDLNNKPKSVEDTEDKSNTKRRRVAKSSSSTVADATEKGSADKITKESEQITTDSDTELKSAKSDPVEENVANQRKLPKRFTRGKNSKYGENTETPSTTETKTKTKSTPKDKKYACLDLEINNQTPIEEETPKRSVRDKRKKEETEHTDTPKPKTRKKSTTEENLKRNSRTTLKMPTEHKSVAEEDIFLQPTQIIEEEIVVQSTLLSTKKLREKEQDQNKTSPDLNAEDDQNKRKTDRTTLRNKGKDSSTILAKTSEQTASSSEPEIEVNKTRIEEKLSTQKDLPKRSTRGKSNKYDGNIEAPSSSEHEIEVDKPLKSSTRIGDKPSTQKDLPKRSTRAKSNKYDENIEAPSSSEHEIEVDKPLKSSTRIEDKPSTQKDLPKRSTRGKNNKYGKNIEAPSQTPTNSKTSKVVKKISTDEESDSTRITTDDESSKRSTREKREKGSNESVQTPNASKDTSESLNADIPKGKVRRKSASDEKNITKNTRTTNKQISSDTETTLTESSDNEPVGNRTGANKSKTAKSSTRTTRGKRNDDNSTASPKIKRKAEDSDSDDFVIKTPSKNRMLDSTTGESTPERTKRMTKPKVVFTMLDSPELQSIVRRLGGRIVDSVESCTVLVTGNLKRSQKLLGAVGLGKPICSPKWLQECKTANVFLDPWDYILEDQEAEKKWKLSLKESLTRSRTNKLLEGSVIYLLVSNAVDVLRGAIESCGGKCVLKQPPKQTEFIVVANAENKAKYSKFLKQNPPIKVVLPEAIFDGVLRQELHFEDYLLG